MKALFIGDVVGRPGRRAVRECLPDLISSRDIDLVVCNAENAAGGFGINPDIVDDLFSYGADVLTGGNHIFDKREGLEVLENNERVLRPHNYPPENPGSGMAVLTAGGARVAVLNLQGRVFMPMTDCPFQAVDRLIESVRDEVDLVVVDLHAEATSEKMAMAWYLDGRAAVLVGTHTHVQTADEQIFPSGLGYISDLGMCGPHGGIIGVKKEQSLSRFLSGRNSRFETARGDVRFHAVLVDLDESTGRATAIERIQRRLN
jgi:2',3'-cyclic-nucleotide 2'-phosphodiesterase